MVSLSKIKKLFFITLVLSFLTGNDCYCGQIFVKGKEEDKKEGDGENEKNPKYKSKYRTACRFSEARRKNLEKKENNIEEENKIIDEEIKNSNIDTNINIERSTIIKTESNIKIDDLIDNPKTNVHKIDAPEIDFYKFNLPVIKFFDNVDEKWKEKQERLRKEERKKLEKVEEPKKRWGKKRIKYKIIHTKNKEGSSKKKKGEKEGGKKIKIKFMPVYQKNKDGNNKEYEEKPEEIITTKVVKKENEENESSEEISGKSLFNLSEEEGKGLNRSVYLKESIFLEKPKIEKPKRKRRRKSLKATGFFKLKSLFVPLLKEEEEGLNNYSYSEEKRLKLLGEEQILNLSSSCKKLEEKTKKNISNIIVKKAAARRKLLKEFVEFLEKANERRFFIKAPKRLLRGLVARQQAEQKRRIFMFKTLRLFGFIAKPIGSLLWSYANSLYHLEDIELNKVYFCKYILCVGYRWKPKFILNFMNKFMPNFMKGKEFFFDININPISVIYSILCTYIKYEIVSHEHKVCAWKWILARSIFYTLPNSLNFNLNIKFKDIYLAFNFSGIIAELLDVIFLPIPKVRNRVDGFYKNREDKTDDFFLGKKEDSSNNNNNGVLNNNNTSYYDFSMKPINSNYNNCIIQQKLEAYTSRMNKINNIDYSRNNINIKYSQNINNNIEESQNINNNIDKSQNIINTKSE